MPRITLFLTLLFFAFTLPAKQIALTFDDAPRQGTHLGAEERTELLINNLKKVKAPKVMFFATGKHLTKHNTPNLVRYADAGHYIAHHSDKHLWYHKTNTEDYQRDFLNAHDKLRSFTNYQNFYHYPFLDAGRSHAKVKAMSEFLSVHGYQHGYVTIDNYDWYLDSLYQKALKAEQPIDESALKQLYVKTLVDATEFFNDIALKYLHKSPKHLLLLHDNDLAALYIDDLIIALRDKGWDIISPLEAYQDPIAEQIPKTLFTGQGRVAALARDKGAKARELVHYAEDENYLKQQFETLVSPNQKCQFDQLAFLTGQWEYRTPKNIYSEHWLKTKNGYRATTKVINLNSSKLIDSETITLNQQNHSIVYSALAKQDNEATDFTLVSCHKNRFAFINKRPNIPQLIVYNFKPAKNSKDDAITVEVKNLKGKGFTLYYRRLHRG